MSDAKFLSELISCICDYAVNNDMVPDETIKIVAENLLKILEISTFNNWEITNHE